MRAPGASTPTSAPPPLSPEVEGGPLRHYAPDGEGCAGHRGETGPGTYYWTPGDPKSAPVSGPLDLQAGAGGGSLGSLWSSTCGARDGEGGRGTLAGPGLRPPPGLKKVVPSHALWRAHPGPSRRGRGFRGGRPTSAFAGAPSPTRRTRALEGSGPGRPSQGRKLLVGGPTPPFLPPGNPFPGAQKETAPPLRALHPGKGWPQVPKPPPSLRAEGPSPTKNARGILLADETSSLFLSGFLGPWPLGRPPRAGGWSRMTGPQAPFLT
jgi:hypothetical protein